MHRRAASAVVWPLAALLLCGCPNPNTYTTPRTLDPGKWQLTVAPEALGFSYNGYTTTANGVSTPVGGGYQTPAPGEVKKPAAGVSIAALVLGIASVVVCCTPLLGIPGLICGIISLRSDQGSGRTMGMVGLILSIIAIVIGTILGIWMIAVGGMEEFMEGFEAGYSGYY